MGSGRRGGSRKSPLSMLRYDIERCVNKYTSAEEIVDHLRSSVRGYSRHPRQTLVRNVRDTLEEIKARDVKVSNPSRAKLVFDDEEDELEETPVRKKMRKIDSREARLQQLEDAHIRRNQKKEEDDESTSSATSSSESDSTDKTEDGVSTSEDAVYGEKLEPEFDLMKSMLRATYSDPKDNAKNLKKNKKRSDDDVKKEKNVELEVVNNKATKKADMLGGRKRDDDSLGIGGCGGGGSGGGEEVKGKEGPKFKDLGGMGNVLEELKMEIIVPLYHPQLPLWLGVRPMAGILLHGPPGCGKTKLAHAIANETGVPFYKISATELVSGVSGASEENIRELFAKAHRTAPSIIFIDEIDAIASKRENLQREMERRIVTQLMTCMDESHVVVKSSDVDQTAEGSNERPGYVLVIGATNRPDAVDSALRRPGRFDREIVLGVPDENARVEILSVLTRKLRVEGTFDLLKIARSTPGFVGADLTALANKAGNIAMKRIIDRRKIELSGEANDGDHAEDWWRHPWLPEEMENLSITMADFEEAAKLVQPSSRREGFSAIPNVKWEDVGGLDFLRQEFDRYIVRRIKHPDDYEGFGVDLETGFLLYGPPGCGKTLIAKAVANEAGANFIHIKGPELLNKYVGESELAVRTIFRRARTCAPCILFFDEVDALTTKRGKEGGWVVERLLNQLLIELDGADQRRGVYVIGATNRPEVMDRAVLRPGRFGKLLYVPLPTPEERGLILKALSRKKPIDSSVDLLSVGAGEACENLSGADLSALINEAAMIALEEKLVGDVSTDASLWTIKDKHFDRALKKISPSVSAKQKEYYGLLSKSFTPA